MLFSRKSEEAEFSRMMREMTDQEGARLAEAEKLHKSKRLHDEIWAIVIIALGVLVVLINIPFVLLGVRAMGKLFAVKVIYAVTLFSVMTAVFEPLVNATSDTILAVVFGGIFLGVGVGLVLRGGSCLP